MSAKRSNRRRIEFVQDRLSPSELERAVRAHVRDVKRVRQLLILRTPPGEAPELGRVIDRARLPGSIVTLAGDDTAFTVCESEFAAEHLRRSLATCAAGR